MSRVLPVLLLTALAGGPVRADGCKFAPDGRLVPEREQVALVEWADGVETLHVAARSDETTAGGVWVVPVRGDAAAVRAEPVEKFPVVTFYRRDRDVARERLRSTIQMAQLLNSGGFCCIGVPLGCSAGGPDVAKEVARVEKHGMVVTVVRAETREEIENYLDAQGVNRKAVNLSSLESYIGREKFAFVCGWTAAGRPMTATGFKIEFPSPTAWFPLRPTSVYADPVETVVYVRGRVKPAAGCDLPRLHCEYVHGVVKELGVGQSFERREFLEERRHYHYEDRPEPLTRVTLTTDPKAWDRDLELIPGLTADGQLVDALAGWASSNAPLFVVALGAVLGVMIPWVTIPKAERKRIDWLAGALVGAAVIFSLWASAFVLAAWRTIRFWERPSEPVRYLILPAFAAVHFLIVFAVCRTLMWLIAAP
jgi:hypothetical protein